MFSQFDNIWSQLLALTPELGKAQSKDPRETVVDIAQTRFLLRELDLVAQDSALHREREVIQDLNTGLSHVLMYKKPSLACASFTAAFTPCPPSNKSNYSRRSKMISKTLPPLEGNKTSHSNRLATLLDLRGRVQPRSCRSTKHIPLSPRAWRSSPC